MHSRPPPQKELLGLLLDEVWDLTDAIEELETRRAILRDHLLETCRAGDVQKWTHERGSLRIDRYASYKVDSPTTLLRQLEFLPWHDHVLSVKGRQLHKLALAHPDVKRAFDARWPCTDHETLVLSPKRRR